MLKKIDPLPIFGVFGFIILSLGIGCTQYIEKPTPSGSIPAPVSSINEVTKGKTQPDDKNGPTDNIEVASKKKKGYGVWERNDDPNRSRHVGREKPYRIIEKFKEYYQSCGKPRFMILVNRKIDSSLSSWQTGDVMIVESSIIGFSGTKKEINSGEAHLNQAQGKIQVYTNRSVPDEWDTQANIKNRSELFKGFAAPFLESGAIIVERSLVMRLFDAYSPKKQDQRLKNKKSIEIKAIAKYADIVIEICTGPFDSGNLLSENVLVEAIAKDLKNGQIIAISDFKEAHENISGNPTFDTETKGFKRKTFSLEEVGELTGIMMLKKMYDSNYEVN